MFKIRDDASEQDDPVDRTKEVGKSVHPIRSGYCSSNVENGVVRAEVSSSLSVRHSSVFERRS